MTDEPKNDKQQVEEYNKQFKELLQVHPLGLTIDDDISSFILGRARSLNDRCTELLKQYHEIQTTVDKLNAAYVKTITELHTEQISRLQWLQDTQRKLNDYAERTEADLPFVYAELPEFKLNPIDLANPAIKEIKKHSI